MKNQSPLKRILILRFSSLGDILMTTPMIRCLKQAHPQAEIDMVVREDFLDLIRLNPHLSKKIGLSREQGFMGLINLRESLNQSQYDLIYDAHRSLRTTFLMPQLKSKYKAYFNKGYLRRNLSLTFKLNLFDSRRFLEKFIDPLLPFGVRYDQKGPEVFLEEESKNLTWKQFSIDDKKTYLGIIPSAQWNGKRWKAEHFFKLCQKILRQRPDYHLILFGGKSDDFCDDIRRALSSDRVINAQGKTTILQSTELLKACKFVVANDTGLMHVADSLKIPQVVVFGPTSKELGCLPFHPLSQTAEKKMWCRPCSKNGQAPCIRISRPCLNLLTVEEVWSKVLQLEKSLGM